MEDVSKAAEGQRAQVELDMARLCSAGLFKQAAEVFFGNWNLMHMQWDSAGVAWVERSLLLAKAAARGWELNRGAPYGEGRSLLKSALSSHSGSKPDWRYVALDYFLDSGGLLERTVSDRGEAFESLASTFSGGI